MPYITVPAAPRHHQMTLDELLNAPPGYTVPPPRGKEGDTRTVYTKWIPDRMNTPAVLSECFSSLRDFVDRHQKLYEADRPTLYRSFRIPKRTRGYRQIDAPNPELMNALRELKTIFETKFYASHHTSAFAYAKKRCAIDAVKKHQENQSRWFLKVDCSNFFGSTTPEFCFRMLKEIWPFSEVMATPAGDELLRKALDLAFLNGGLPQGTPLSPMLTNVVMIPLDHYFANKLRNFDGTHFIYTRYADDITISSRFDFNKDKMIEFIKNGFGRCGAPYTIKDEKTHYGSNAGRNWILGVMYNKDFKITIGYKQKNAFRSMLNDYIRSKQRGQLWSLGDVQQLQGLIAYYKKVDADYVNGCIEHYSVKFGMNVITAIRHDLKTL